MTPAMVIQRSAGPPSSAWPPADSSHVADTSPPVRRQMLVGVNAAELEDVIALPARQSESLSLPGW